MEKADYAHHPPRGSGGKSLTPRMLAPPPPHFLPRFGAREELSSEVLPPDVILWNIVYTANTARNAHAMKKESPKIE